jgi:hypothetical protein
VFHFVIKPAAVAAIRNRGVKDDDQGRHRGAEAVNIKIAFGHERFYARLTASVHQKSDFSDPCP